MFSRPLSLTPELPTPRRTSSPPALLVSLHRVRRDFRWLCEHPSVRPACTARTAWCTLCRGPEPASLRTASVPLTSVLRLCAPHCWADLTQRTHPHPSERASGRAPLRAIRSISSSRTVLPPCSVCSYTECSQAEACMIARDQCN